jgi:hypothetical protein
MDFEVYPCGHRVYMDGPKIRVDRHKIFIDGPKFYIDRSYVLHRWILDRTKLYLDGSRLYVDRPQMDLRSIVAGRRST